MNKWSVSGAVTLVSALSSLGCGALLGLDDKDFGDTGGTTTTGTTATGGAGGTTASGGTGGSGATGGTGGTGAGGTTSSGGTTASGGSTTGGAGGGDCTAGSIEGRLDDEFDFPLCDPNDTSFALKARGWHLAWQEEGYPVPPVGLNLHMGALQIMVQKSVYWFDGEAGPFLQKPISGAFLLVAEVTLSRGNDPLQLPPCAQAGVGIMVRDPASAAGSLERWVAVDRGSNNLSGTVKSAVHGSWSDGLGAPDQDSVFVQAPASGKIALARDGAGQFHIFTKSGGIWTIQDSFISGFSDGGMPDALEAGLFLYAYDSPKLDPIPNGVMGTVEYVHQYDLTGGSYNPADYGE